MDMIIYRRILLNEPLWEKELALAIRKQHAMSSTDRSEWNNYKGSARVAD